jgi:tetratricopeptide (TPR) repeat protein
LYQYALKLRRHLLGDKHPDVATSLNNLTLLYYFQGRYAEAESLLQQALEIFEQRLGVNHPNTVTVRENLANLRQQLASDTRD